MITTHHIREFPVKGADLHLYCGRESSFRPREGLINARMGSRHPLGYCPKCGRSHDREDSIQSFREDQLDLVGFARRIERMRKLHKEGKHIALYCFCKPEACHTDAIKAEVEK